MNRDRWIVLALLAGLLLAWGGAAAVLPHVQARRKALQLAVHEDLNRNLPPEMAAVAVAGSFQGLAIDYFWARATTLQQEGKYYEAKQLADWITTLQPRFAQVWSFQAWNMAYNISEAVKTPEEKWLWVQEGVRLLRDAGIPTNPRNPELYRELSYMIFHRIGKFSIDEHWYFKQRFAEEWQGVVGEPPGGGLKDALAHFAFVADAPASLSELRADAAAAAQLDALAALGYRPDAQLLARVGDVQMRYVEILEGGSGAEQGAPEAATRRDADAKLLAWLDDPKTAGARGQVLGFARAKVLREQYHMDPKFMHEMMESFGPLDWRHHAAHALYWALLGSKYSGEIKNPNIFEAFTSDRLAFDSLRDLVQTGRLGRDLRFGVPDPRFFDGFERVLDQMAQWVKGEPGYEKALREKRRGFLEEATEISCRYGSLEEADAYYAKLRAEFGKEYRGQYDVPLADFMRKINRESLKQFESARMLVHSFAVQAIRLGWATGRPEVAQRYLGQAKACYDAYMSEENRPKRIERKARELPPVEVILGGALESFLLAPPSAVDVRAKLRVWHGMRAEHLQYVYDQTVRQLHAEARRAGLDPEKAFPPPPGMDAYRKALKEAEAREMQNAPKGEQPKTGQ